MGFIHTLVSDYTKSDVSISPHTAAYVASGVVGLLIVSVVLIGVLVWKMKQSAKETTTSNQGI